MALEVKNLPASAGDTKATDPITGRPPWRRKWQPTPVFLPEKFHGQSSVVGCSSWSCKESDTTEPAHTHTHTHTHARTFKRYAEIVHKGSICRNVEGTSQESISCSRKTVKVPKLA